MANNMIYLLLLSLCLTVSSQILQYSFYKNFGQVFYDYSLNEFYGTNGQSTSIDNSDTTPTDRGAYFSEDNSLITLPLLSKSSTPLQLPGTYPSISILIWFNQVQSGGRRLDGGCSRSLDGDGCRLRSLDGCESSQSSDYLFYRGSGSSNYFYIKLTSNQHIAVRLKTASTDTNDLTSSGSYQNSKPYLDAWSFVCLTFDTNIIKVYLDGQQVTTHSLTFTYAEATNTYSSTIGHSDGSTNSFKGYVWEFQIVSGAIAQSSYCSTTSTSASSCLLQELRVLSVHAWVYERRDCVLYFHRIRSRQEWQWK